LATANWIAVLFLTNLVQPAFLAQVVFFTLVIDAPSLTKTVYLMPN
jgi:hypothetical protein